MADREPDPETRSELSARIAPGIGDFAPAEWDALAGDGDPFLTHAFLYALEQSGSVGPGTGWDPLPIVVDRGTTPVAVAPAYVKRHSQGEYVFDHGWADAWQRAGGEYYPKLQIAVPFTPVPGRRLLGHEPQALLSAIESITRDNNLSSAHATFLTDVDVAHCAARRWLIRDGIQYHWFNRDYATFEDFLAAMSSRKRKSVRKERATAQAGLRIESLTGSAIRPEHWDAMWDYYQDTGARKWGRPYLTRGFFDLLGAHMADRVLLVLAFRDDTIVAGALNLIGADTLYGRYWGASEDLPFLHFELCYYQAIDWAIAHGLACVQAGAQGEHKLARGYEPIITRSAHFLPNPGFRNAVADFVEAERAAIANEITAMRADLPFRATD